VYCKRYREKKYPKIQDAKVRMSTLMFVVLSGTKNRLAAPDVAAPSALKIKARFTWYVVSKRAWNRPVSSSTALYTSNLSLTASSPIYSTASGCAGSIRHG
jgi:hypothetical protein